MAHAEWEKVGADWYVDYERVKQNNNNNYLVWMLVNEPSHNSKSATMLIELDCKVLKFRMLGAKKYEKKWALGDVIDSHRETWSWEYYDPHSDWQKNIIARKFCR